MADIINPITNKEEAKQAAERMVARAQGEVGERKLKLDTAIKEIAKLSPADGGFEEIAVLLALPEEHFEVLAPVFLEELQKNFDNLSTDLTTIIAQLNNILTQE